MVGKRLLILLVLGAPGSPSALSAQEATTQQTDSDHYTRYELLGPDTQSFRIVYDVTATAAGAKHYFNPLRAGSEHTVASVHDRASGKPLKWKIVKGVAGKTVGIGNLRDDGDYLQVELPRPVPSNGGVRIRIDKTYRDPESYLRDGENIRFSRSLGIRRNAVVLPAGYELLWCNYPSQVVTESDGRMKVSFINPGPDAVSYQVLARPLNSVQASEPQATPFVGTPGAAAESPPANTPPAVSSSRASYEFPERAGQTRDIVYFLQQPETHSFRLYHDYTETRPGTDQYRNVVRQGSRVSNPSAYVLDTGEQLKVETTTLPAQTTERNAQTTEVVVIRFKPVAEGESLRLRIEETYTDPNRYQKVGEELVWDRSFGRSRNTVVLPEGWYLTASAVPAVVSERDGKVQLTFVNDRPGNLDVFIKARRR